MAKKEDKAPTTVEGVMNAINAKYKTTVVEIASKAKSLKGIRLKTGIFELDVKIGGGWVKGRVHVLKGEFSTGKTYVCTKTISSAQRHCRVCNTPFTSIDQKVYNVGTGELVQSQTITDMEEPLYGYRLTEEDIDNELEDKDFKAEYTYYGCECGENKPHVCAFIDAEGTYHPTWAEDQGVINDALHIVQTEFAEQAIDVIEALARSGMVDLFVVDSVPALTPSKEIEDSAEDQHVGTHARLMNRFMRVLQSAINSLGMGVEQKPVFLLVNQLRQKVGVMFGNPETSPGGKGIDFAASIIVRMGAAQRIKINPVTGKIVDKDGVPVGAALCFTVPKNKTFPPFQDGTFEIDTDNFPDFGYRKGKVNNDEKIISFAGDVDVVQKGGGGYYSYIDPETGEVIKAQGAPTFTALLKEKGLFDAIAKETLKKATNKVSH